MKIKPCPFCGNERALEAVSDMELDSDNPENKGYQFAVVCNVHKGGCGSTCGWQFDKEEAIEAWNRRTP